MTHWLASSNRDNQKILDAKHIWGVPRRNKTLMHRVKPGDTILVYVRQEKVGDTILPSAITGAYEVVAEPYIDHSRLFVTPPQMGDEVFPYRMKVRPVAVFAEPLEFKPLIPDLTFITNKTMWSGHLRQAMREIPAEDYQLILRRAGVEAQPMPEITGVTFPVPKSLMPRFFEDGKTVFIKPATAFKELRSGMKLVFYQSREDTGYVGEATIRRIVINDDPLAFFETFGDAVFLTREETRAYVEGQGRWQGVRVRKGEAKKRPWMALELEDIREYDRIKKPERFVPVGGRYLREYVP